MGRKKSTKEKKNPNLRKPREMPDQSYMTPNISYKFEKQRKEMVFSLKKQKELKEYLSFPHPPLNKKKMNNKKISLFERKVKKKRTLCIICLSSSKKREKTPIR